MESEAGTKLVFIVCDQGIEPDVKEILTQHELRHYTRWTDCEGAGETGTHQGNPIWPGLNSVVMIVMPEEQIEPLRADLHDMRQHFPITPGLKLIITDAVMI